MTPDEIWIARIERFARRLETTWKQFESLTDDLTELGDDLPAEEIAPVFAVFDELVRLGVRFDPAFILTMTEAREAAAALNVDGLDDDSDELVDWDDSDMDGPDKYKNAGNTMKTLFNLEGRIIGVDFGLGRGIEAHHAG